MEMVYISEKWKIPGGNTGLKRNVNLLPLAGDKTPLKTSKYAYFISSAPILDFTASESLTRKIGSLGRVNWAWKEARERNGVPAGELGETGLVQSQH